MIKVQIKSNVFTHKSLIQKDYETLSVRTKILQE